MEQVCVIKDDKVVSRSRNLRGILDYGRKYGFKRIAVTAQEPEGVLAYHGLLEIEFADGATARAEFASYGVLLGWLACRRSWIGSGLVVNGYELGPLTKEWMGTMRAVSGDMG